MTSKKTGPLSIFHVYGSESGLAEAVDRRVGPRRGPAAGALGFRELRYGWLSGSSEGEAVDEVMLARPVDGLRVLMTHGGAGVAAAVRGFFASLGVEEATGADGIVPPGDILFDAVASGCLTEAQAGAVLAWRAGGEEPPPGLLATHRVVLAGPPNAGKSSLLNRLSGYERAFVHAEAGATRDVVDELADVGGYAVWIGDLPGYSLRSEGGGVEGEAWRRAGERLGLCEAVWFVVDGSRPWEGESAEAARAVAARLRPSGGGVVPQVTMVINKSDLPPAWDGEPWRGVFPEAGAVRVCSLPDGDAEEGMGAVAEALWGGGVS